MTLNWKYNFFKNSAYIYVEGFAFTQVGRRKKNIQTTAAAKQVNVSDFPMLLRRF